MIEQNTIYAVITGDLVKSTSLGEERAKVLKLVKETLACTANFIENKKELILSSGIFRGDSFQLLISDYTSALKIALFIQARLLQADRSRPIQARMALGLGRVESVNPDSIAESYGEAFLFSGRSLDAIDSYRRLDIHSSSVRLNIHLKVLTSCLDAITTRWTTGQAEALMLWLEGHTQKSIANKLNISQPAVQQRLQLAGMYAIKETLEYFDWLFTEFKLTDQS
jgi:hypothetical protein